MHQFFEISTSIPGTIMIGIENSSKKNRNRDLLPSNFGGSDGSRTWETLSNRENNVEVFIKCVGTNYKGNNKF